MGSTAPSYPCDTYLLFHGETLLSNRVRAFIYTVALSYCFIGLSVITGRFFKAMENIVKQSREVVTMDPHSNTPVVKHEKVWNYTIADISLLAFGTSFPQISLATIDAIRNMGQLTAGGLGPGTLIGSAAFDLFPIHAVCVIMPRAGSLKKISDLGVCVRGERPEDWVPEEDASVDTGNDEISEDIEDMFSVDLYHNTEYSKIPEKDMEGSPIMNNSVKNTQEKLPLVYIWWQHFVDAVTLESPESRKMDSACLSNSVNIYVGIGVPWLIDTMYNYFVYQEPLYIDNADGLSFSLVVFFATSFGCITVLVLRRIILGAELGGPRLWAWMTSTYFMTDMSCSVLQSPCINGSIDRRDYDMMALVPSAIQQRSRTKILDLCALPNHTGVLSKIAVINRDPDGRCSERFHAAAAADPACLAAGDPPSAPAIPYFQRSSCVWRMVPVSWIPPPRDAPDTGGNGGARRAWSRFELFIDVESLPRELCCRRCHCHTSVREEQSVDLWGDFEVFHCKNRAAPQSRFQA
ncbi:hypothetical protein PR202_ga22669 [Eleusine coracana subsp. coracana]|uniref:Sodium/calcium exchanger membrane region domain-containing protein n=1 Tax=Eleusine coracana subsp. coracana TaxID=191504 RepID=A0AAV5D2B8_ELECO|nr:hypothetical protein PR202_ga22669 [Eleusine coracana subsp. coracana]